MLGVLTPGARRDRFLRARRSSRPIASPYHRRMTTMTAPAATGSIASLLGPDASALLGHRAKVDRSALQLPGPDFIDRVWTQSDRSPQVLRSLAALFQHGRLAGTGYLSIL